MSTPNVENYVLGRGSLYYSPWNETTLQYEAERHLGNSPEVSFQASVDRLDHFSSMSGIKAKDKTAVQQASPKLSFTLEEFVAENWKLLAYGSDVAVSQAASGEISVPVVAPVLGRYYDLGKYQIQTRRIAHGTVTGGPFQTGETITGGTSTATAKILKVESGQLIVAVLTGTFAASETITGGTSSAHATSSSLATAVSGLVVCKSTSGNTYYAPTTDFIVDARTGQVLITPESNIDEDVTFTFGCAALNYTKIQGLTSLSSTGKLRFVSDNPEGKNYIFEAWKCQVAPNGDTGFISSEWGSMKFEADILRDATYHPDSPYFDIHSFE